jgi:ubiquinone/menaquinone biosynthesis C-methylase UbiE
LKLNWLGRAAMNNEIRALAQRRFVAARMKRLGGELPGGEVLEVGCGQGRGVEILLDEFRARRVHGFDLDIRMVTRARRRLAGRPPKQVLLSLGDATRIAAPDAWFDAVFDFGAIHLVPDWQDAVAEVQRVLKPGGIFFFELVASRWLRLPYVFVTERFRRMKAPGAEEFLSELERIGIAVGGNVSRPTAAWTGLIGDLIGAGRKGLEGTGQNRPG